MRMISDLAPVLDGLYARYNRRETAGPDPVLFLYRYEDVRDREMAGFIASALAYGRVAQIMKNVALILDRMGRHPAHFLARSSRKKLHRVCAGFKHRFTTGEELAETLCGVNRAARRWGSLEACFLDGLNDGDETVLPALSPFVRELACGANARASTLLADPSAGSACKRLNLFLRWMVRNDAVDPGGWHNVSPSKLIVPLDTHMHRIGRALGFTTRRQADMRTALEITAAFRKIAPNDPVRYDFSLTRLGIRGDGNLNALLARAT